LVVNNKNAGHQRELPDRLRISLHPNVGPLAIFRVSVK
jgi:hypothetical protein